METMMGGDMIKGKPHCSKNGGGAARPAGWTGSNKTVAT